MQAWHVHLSTRRRPYVGLHYDVLSNRKLVCSSDYTVPSLRTRTDGFQTNLTLPPGTSRCDEWLPEVW